MQFGIQWKRQLNRYSLGIKAHAYFPGNEFAKKVGEVSPKTDSIIGTASHAAAIGRHSRQSSRKGGLYGGVFEEDVGRCIKLAARVLAVKVFMPVSIIYKRQQTGINA